MRFGIALIHAEKIAGEQRRLVAAGAGADFEDGAFLVGRILRQQRDAQLLFERLEPQLGLAQLLFGEARHLGVGRGIVQHGLEAGDFRALRAVIADRRGDLFESGEFARQRDESRRLRRRVEAGGDFVVAAQDEIELFLRQHVLTERDGGTGGSRGEGSGRAVYAESLYMGMP